MAAVFGPFPASIYQSRNSMENFARLCQLMMTVCVDLFRDLLSYYIDHEELQTKPTNNQEHTPSIRNYTRQELSHSYVCSLSKKPSTKHMNLSLLYLSLRFSCNIAQPANGWGNRPENDDKSLAACIERLRILGKLVLDHSKRIGYTEFCNILLNLRTNIKEIQNMVLGKDTYAQAIDDLFCLNSSRSSAYIRDFQSLQSKNYDNFFIFVVNHNSFWFPFDLEMGMGGGGC